ncbi:hypothetical protein [Clostridium oceanicum]|uniref:Uncharacterized protein n=1 Tax=Clostridium oceanicum TaxID=1543 RepID=A0ABN1JK88_9CLOT
MKKKLLICPMGIAFILLAVFLFQKFYMSLPFSHEDAYVLSNIAFIGVIIFSFIGAIQNIKIFRKNKENAISFILAIVFIVICLFATLWLFVVLSFEACNPDSILYKIFVKPR